RIGPFSAMTWHNNGISFAAWMGCVSFRVPQGRTVALVGESGSRKSVTFQTIMGILPKSGTAGLDLGPGLPDAARAGFGRHDEVYRHTLRDRRAVRRGATAVSGSARAAVRGALIFPPTRRARAVRPTWLRDSRRRSPTSND